jgi:hypothetical protein
MAKMVRHPCRKGRKDYTMAERAVSKIRRIKAAPKFLWQRYIDMKAIRAVLIKDYDDEMS